MIVKSRMLVLLSLLCKVVQSLYSIPRSISSLFSISLSMPIVPKKIVVSTIASAFSVQTPLGDIGEAFDAIWRSQGEAVTCVLDWKKADDTHDSCQLKDDVVRWRAGRLMTFKQDWGRTKSTGAAIWNGANMAGWYLEKELGSKQLKNSRVIELGAGVGYTSIIAKQLGAEEVLVTDGDEGVLRIADKNINLNFDRDAHNIRTAQLRWNSDDETKFIDHDRPWDFILIADCKSSTLSLSEYHLYC